MTARPGRYAALLFFTAAFVLAAGDKALTCRCFRTPVFGMGIDDRADYAILRKEDRVYLGDVVLSGIDEDNRSGAFRIALTGPDVFGKGYGTEATRLLLGYAFDVVGLHRVSLEVFDFNPRAQRAYEKAGFVREGLQREALWWDGEWHDVVTMAILKNDPRL